MEKILLGDAEAVKKAVMILDEGGIVMHPTETCYGLAVDVFNESALRKLYLVKGMKMDKPLSILVDSMEMACEYGVFSKKALQLAKKYWPGALSIMAPRTKFLPEYFNKGNEFVSMRISGLQFCRELVAKLGEPITTTSANKAGEEPFYRPGMMSGVDLIVDGGEIPMKKPSTVVKVVGSVVKIVRQGDLVLP